MIEFKNALSILKECMKDTVPFEASSEEARIETAMIEYGKQCALKALELAADNVKTIAAGDGIDRMSIKETDLSFIK